MRTRIVATVAVLAIVVIATVARAQQQSSILTVHFGSSQVVFDNTSDAFAKETVYDTTGIIKHVAKTLCIAPHTTDSRMFKSQVSQVRAEVSNRNCKLPVMLDRTLQVQGPGAFIVAGRRSHYTFAQRQ